MNYEYINGGANGSATKLDVPAVWVTDEKDQEKDVVIDAGLRSLDHYRRALPRWRYELRQRSLPLIRWETPYLAWMQDRVRSPTLDSYFAITANMGTHTFFMIGLPIIFWCGYQWFGKGLVHILAAGVFFTGFVKDFFSLPRPLSPPLYRITMSGSAALEYGFPSTHSANSVSVAVYGLLILHSPDNPLEPNVKIALEALAYCYAASIVYGRLYCGMHGFLDVVAGSFMGWVFSVVEFYYGPVLDLFLREHDFKYVLYVVLVILVLIRIHPEPADDCPCFDDSVAFAGVVMGVELGTWHYNRSPYASIPFSFSGLGWFVVLARIVFGVLVIFAWRELAKPTLLKTLPHFFRIIEVYGMNMPRRFFTPASKYTKIPLRLQVDNVIPNASDIPGLVSTLRKSGRGRAVSIGPQSAADAYETLAYRERKRRESMDSNGSLRTKESLSDLKSNGRAVSPFADGQAARSTAVSGRAGGKISDYEEMMGEGTVVVTPADDEKGEFRVEVGESDFPRLGQQQDGAVDNDDDLGEKEVFAQLVKPRVRYDVEVVTKLVVYTGIGVLAVDIIPILFELIGLGSSNLPYK